MNRIKKSWWAVLLTIVATLVMSASPAGAQVSDDPYERPPVVLPSVVERPVDPGPPVVLGDVTTRPAAAPSTAGLPVTGGDTLTLALLGTGALVLGGGMMLAARRRGTNSV